MKQGLLYLLLAIATAVGAAELARPAQAAASPRHDCNNMWWIHFEQGCVGQQGYNCWHPYYFCPCDSPTCVPPPPPDTTSV